MAFSILLRNLLVSQGFIAIPAGEQGEEITQTPGDVTELMYNPCEPEQITAEGKSRKNSKDPVKARRDDGCQAERPSRDRPAYSSPQILRITPHVQFCPGTEKLPTGVME